MIVCISVVVWAGKRLPNLDSASKRSSFVMPAAAQPGAASRATSSAKKPFFKDGKPDDYFIILDGYARADFLEDLYGYDNKPFLDYLESRGFYVAERSSANYPLTFLSLAATLNMRHVDDVAAALIETYGEETKIVEPFYDLIQSPKVAEFFKAKGYRYATFLTNWSGTDRSKTADLKYNFSPLLGGEFINVLLRTTVLRSLAPSIAQSHLYAFNKIKEIPQLEGPTFTFAHLLLPHNPYVFDRHGNVRNNIPLTLQFKEKTGSWANKRAYIEQLLFLNDQVKEIIDHILTNSNIDPIIIIQADHGSATTPFEKAKIASLTRERLAILNAMRVPEATRNRLYPTITSINTIPILLSTVFEENIPTLPDTSYFSSYRQPYPLQDVTETVAARERENDG